MTSFARRALVVAISSLLLACGDDAATGGATAEREGGDALGETLGRFEGRWQVRARNEAGDTLPSHVLTATAEPTGWTVTFPNRPPVAARVIDASGSLVVIETDSYESVLRPGVQVRVLFVHRLTGDGLTGRFWANYDVQGAAAILRGTTDGTRAQ